MTNNIDTLYELIKTSTNLHKTFIDNLNLWKQFYSDRDIILRNNFLNPKLFTIIKFLLEQEHEEIFEYFHGEILTILRRHQEQLSYNLEKEENNITTNINNLFTNLGYYDDLCEYVKQLNLDDPLGEVNKYLNSFIQLDTARTLTILISKNFFMLDNELVKKTITFISKSSQLVATTRFKNKAETREFIYKYLDNILKIKLFIGDELSNDPLIKLIKTHQIQDKKVINYLFNELSINLIIKIFDNNINSIINFINESTYLDEVFKIRIVINLITNILETEIYNPLVLDIIVKDNLPLFLPEELKNTLYNKIIINGLNTPIFELSSDMIKCLLTSDYKDTNVENMAEETFYYGSSEKFIKECHYLLRKEEYIKLKDDFDDNEIKQILSTLDNLEEYYLTQLNSDIAKEEKAKAKYNLGLDIDYKTAIELLTNYLEDKITLTESSAKAIMRSIATGLLEALEIENNGIYYHKSNNNYGLYHMEELCISINTKLINIFLNSKNSLYNRLKILNTILHEITHALCKKTRKEGQWNPDTYRMLKEDIIAEYDLDYYEENYLRFKEEIEARIGGINSLSKFIETFLPHLLDKIQDRIIEDLLEEKELRDSKYNDLPNVLNNLIKEFNLVFDTLISYNPDIIKNNPILSIEYYPDGNPKTIEDIYLSRTEDNTELITDILIRRYPDTMQQNLKTGYKK